MNVTKNPMCFRSGWCYFSLLSGVLDIKTQRYIPMSIANRGESTFTFLSDVVSLLDRATRARSLLFLSLSLPLTAFTLDRSLPASATHRESCSSDLARSRRHFFFLVDFSLPAFFLLKTLLFALALISSTHLLHEVASRLAILPCVPPEPGGLICACVTPFSIGLHKGIAAPATDTWACTS